MKKKLYIFITLFMTSLANQPQFQNRLAQTRLSHIPIVFKCRHSCSLLSAVWQGHITADGISSLSTVLTYINKPAVLSAHALNSNRFVFHNSQFWPSIEVSSKNIKHVNNFLTSEVHNYTTYQINDGQRLRKHSDVTHNR
jgi:hypothetical protein